MNDEPRQMLHLRIPASLHAELTRRAQEQGVSLNNLVIALLAGAIGFNLKKKRAGK
jgi:predicted HicB family RNase H-like nuclease